MIGLHLYNSHEYVMCELFKASFYDNTTSSGVRKADGD